MIGSGQVQCLRDHADHRGEVGVIEHDPLGLAGGAARVDEQGQRVPCGLADRVAADGCRRKRRHLDRGHTGEIGRRSLMYQQACAGVSDLERGFAGREARVDRRERGAASPRGEHDDHQLDAIAQHRGDHVAGADPGRAEHRRRSLDAGEESGVGEREPIVVDARCGRVERGALVGEGCQRRREGHEEESKDGSRSWLRAAATNLWGSLVRPDRGTWRFARTPVRRAPSGAGARRRARSRARRSGCAGRGYGR